MLLVAIVGSHRSKQPGLMLTAAAEHPGRSLLVLGQRNPASAKVPVELLGVRLDFPHGETRMEVGYSDIPFI